MKSVVSVILSLLILSLLLACNITLPKIPLFEEKQENTLPPTEPQPTSIPPTATNEPQPTPIPPTATNEPQPTPIPPTATNEPQPTPIPPTATSAPQVNLSSVNVGNDFWLTYDTDLWTVNNEHGYNILQSKNHRGCNFMYQAGHGMDMTVFEVHTTSQTLGGKTFKVDRWTRIANGDLVVLAFFYGQEDISVENQHAEALSPECESQAFDVITLSAEKDFMP